MNNQKKTPSPKLGRVISAAVVILMSVGFIGDVIEDFVDSILPQWLEGQGLGGMTESVADTLQFGVVLVIIIAVTAILTALAKHSIKQKAGGVSFASDGHTHDKFDTAAFNPNETPEEHYMKQLKGFLDAGIIDKAEFNTLSAKYKS